MDKSMWNEYCPLCNWGFYVDPLVYNANSEGGKVYDFVCKCVKCGSVWLSKKK